MNTDLTIKNPLETPITFPPSKNETSKSNAAEIGQKALSANTLSKTGFTISKKIEEIDLAYYRLTRRILKKNKIVIEKQLENLPEKELHITQLLEALRRNDWKDPIFENLHYPYFALAAVKEGKLTPFEFSTVMFYWATVESHVSSRDEIESIPLFIEGEPNPIAIKLISETMIYGRDTAEIFRHGFTNTGKSYISEEQLNELFERMKEFPLSEQQFFLIPRPIDKKPTIKSGIQAAKFNIFADIINFKDQSQSKQMIPSLNLMQSFLDIKFQTNARRINPTLGDSPFSGIVANGCLGERDMGIPSPFKKMPERADGSLASGFYFPYHDFYHSFIVSGSPMEHGPAFIRAAYCVREAINTQEMRDYYALIVDMENRRYHENYGFPYEKFWMELIAKSYFNFDASLLERKILVPFFYVLSDYLRNREDWKSEFNIDSDLLIIKESGHRLFAGNDFAPRWESAMNLVTLAQQVQSLILEGNDQNAKGKVKILQLADQPFFFTGITDKDVLKKVLVFMVELGKDKIDLSGNKLVADEHIELIARNPKLAELNLQGCTQLSEKALGFLQKTKSLQTLNLGSCTQLLGILEKIPPQVLHLKLEGTKGLSDEHVGLLVKTHPNLKTLDLRESATDKAMEHLKSMKSLKKIILSYSPELTDAGLSIVARNPSVTEIQIENCTKITPKKVNFLLQERKGNGLEDLKIHRYVSI